MTQAPLWCDLGFFPNSRGNKAATNLRPMESRNHMVQGLLVTNGSVGSQLPLLVSSVALETQLRI